MKALATCCLIGIIASSALRALVVAAAQEQEVQAHDDDGPPPPPSSSSSCSRSNDDDHDDDDDGKSCQAQLDITSSSAKDENDDDDNNLLGNGPCTNADLNCYRRAALGECKSHVAEEYMTTHCSRACGRCPRKHALDEVTIQQEEEAALRSEADGPVELDCHDLHEMCPIWSGQGECLLNAKYMATACRESCLLCINARASRERGEDADRIRRKRAYVTSVDVGPQQRIDGTAEQQDKIRNLLQHMDRYAKVNLTDVDVSPTARVLCRNEHDECASLAVRGQCRKDSLYMLAHCSLMCQFCDKVEKFHRCTSNNGNGYAAASSLFKEAGDLNSFFRRGKESSRWGDYGPEYLSQPGDHIGTDGEADTKNGSPWIVRFDSFLSASESKRLIEIANGIGWSDSKVEEEEMFEGNSNKVPPRRTSKSAICGVGAGCDSDMVYSAVIDRVADTIGISRDNFEHTEIVKYEHRDSFSVHHDYRIHNLWKPGAYSFGLAQYA